MRRALFTTTVLLLASVLLPSAARAQAGAGAAGGGFTIRNVTPSQVTTPEFQVSATEAKRFVPGKWLEIETEFSAPPPGAQELTFKYYVLINNQLLTGEVTHINILPGQSLFSIMYVAPRTLTQILKGQPFTTASVQNAEVQIVRPGVGAPVATKQIRPGPLLSASNAQQLPGMMLNKNDTPYAPLYWDRYEAIKATPAR